MTRSQCAFIRGARGAVLTTSMPSAAKTASKDSVYFASRSRSRKRSDSTRRPNSTARFLACCTVQRPVGCAVTPAMCSRRAPCSRNTSAYTRRRSTRSMWTKSQAMMPSACAVRNSRHVGPLRRGAGSMPAAVRISQTVVELTGCPSRTSSPWIRRQPQRGFSLASRSTSAFTVLAVGGLPGLLRRSL